MLMVNRDDASKLQPIAKVFTPEMFAELSRNALAISANLEVGRVKRNAEVFPDVTPHWHVATVMPGRERTAADELSERCFGVYLPESEHVEIRRGRKVDLKRLMLPGYVFVYVWDVDRHMDRIRACEGVRGMLFINGRVAVVPDVLVNRVRAAENRRRPLAGLPSADVVKIKKRWRKSQKSKEERMQEQAASDNDVLCVHSYSPFIEALRADAEGERLSAFHRAIGLTA